VQELQLNPGEVKYKLLLHNEEDRQLAWFLAAKSENLKLLKELLALAKQKGNPEEIKSKLLLARNDRVRLLCTWQQKPMWQYWRNCGLF
jgi:hypothetical protein